MTKRVLITGATGMVGSGVLQNCLQSEQISQVISLGRRASGAQNPKLQEIIIKDFLNLDESAEYFQNIDTVYYCLGAYTGSVSRDLFRQINIDYPETLAKVIQANNSSVQFCLLSGQGADRTEKSRMAFAKDKGIIENKLSKMEGIKLHSFRPGYIYPVMPREEPNFSYKLSRWLYPLVKLFGNNMSIQSTQLSEAIFRVGLDGQAEEILENRDILAILA